MVTYGTMNSEGRWGDVKANRIDRALEQATHHNGMSLTDVLATLAAGQDVHYGPDWYEVLRQKQVPQPRPVAAQRIHCDCGHNVAAVSVMHASVGTSCVDCYDRLSA